MAQKLRKHGKKLEKTSVGCDIDFTILLSMLKVKETLHLSPNAQNVYSCIDIYAHSCLKPFLIGRKPCSNRKTHVQIMKFTCRLNMGFGRRHWSK